MMRKITFKHLIDTNGKPIQLYTPVKCDLTTAYKAGQCAAQFVIKIFNQK